MTPRVVWYGPIVGRSGHIWRGVDLSMFTNTGPGLAFLCVFYAA